MTDFNDQLLAVLVLAPALVMGAVWWTLNPTWTVFAMGMIGLPVAAWATYNVTVMLAAELERTRNRSPR